LPTPVLDYFARITTEKLLNFRAQSKSNLSEFLKCIRS